VRSATTSYPEAFGRLNNCDAAAIAAFAAHIGKHSPDQLASFHLNRLLNAHWV
jgi:hypothetical protein